MHFPLLIYSVIFPVQVSNRVTIHHQGAVTVYAAYDIYHAEYIKIIYTTMFYISNDNVYISNFYTILVHYQHGVYIRCIYSNCLLIINSYSIRNM